MNSLLGIIVNPFSGRDVRRVAARASTSDHHEKQQQVTRLVLGALSRGVDRIFLAHEPFRINEKAVENLPERDQVEILKFPLTHSSRDTVTMSRMMWERGCRTFIVLGGDGTSRIVAGAYPDATLLPLSTGTNNVFPYRLEASVAGMAAGLIASGAIEADACLRCKRVHVKAGDRREIALIDAVLLKNDFIGSLLPFAAENLGTLVLTRAEPASVGVSPIAGFAIPTGHHDNWGVVAECSDAASTRVNVPISPGLHAYVGIEEVRRLALGETVNISGPGIIAFDGDRLIQLDADEEAEAHIERDGPRIIEAEQILKLAAERNLLRETH